MKATPKRGVIAENENGELGVIVDYFKGEAVGFALFQLRTRWASRRPKVLGTVQEWINSRLPVSRWVNERNA